MPLDFEFHLGHVERVFTNKEDMEWYAGSANKAERSTSQIILLSPTAGLLPSMKNKRYARPLLRGVSDSITRGDLVLYTSIASKYFYLGPLILFLFHVHSIVMFIFRRALH